MVGERSLRSSCSRVGQDLLAALALLHVDEVHHDDPAQVPEPDLAHDLPHRVEVGLEERVFENPLSHEAAGVHVDGDQGLGLVDDDVAAGGEPDLGAQRALELRGDAVLLEDRVPSVVQAHPRGEVGEELGDEVEGSLELALVVETDRPHVARQQVAQEPLHERGLPVEEGGRRLPGGEGPRFVPGLREVAPVAQEVVAVTALARGARDEAPAPALLPDLLENGLEAAPLLVVVDLPRDAHVLDRGHEDDVAAGQGHVGGDPRPLGAERLLQDLHHHVLPFVQAILDGQGILVDELFGGEQVLRQLLEDVGDVQEGVSLLADVDEGRLHPREDPGHPPFVDVADDAVMGGALDEDLGDGAVLKEGNLRLLRSGADDQVSGHGRSLP